MKSDEHIDCLTHSFPTVKITNPNIIYSTVVEVVFFNGHFESTPS